MQFAVDRLNEGCWVHLYPEGKVNLSKEPMRIKWGVGRMVAECKRTPIVIPIYHLGMDSILPNQTPDFPRFRKKVTIIVGRPIKIEETLEELNKSNATALEKRLVITNLIQKQLYSLKITAEIYHARHLAGGRP